MYINALGVRVNAAARGSHVDQDDAFADATDLCRRLIETGFIMQFGSVSATVTDDGGEWRGRLVEVFFRPAD
jgi:hypothetical protein